VQVGVFDSFCFDGCTTDAQCRQSDGYACEPIQNGGAPVACLPHG
jgi:hypothetical protein